ncbi:nuclear receptor-binding protein 2 [Serinus canaria]|uniref:nuclear receptor-binding protein 2 n=1 Tax=Serinus canaria TaxID=9135 RepID=UPI0021CD0D46|nr:nuclear receptor-binding protein 2 [Serinus canaria]
MAVPEPDARLAQEKEEESEEESEVLEESPCGRWQKRREQVGAVERRDGDTGRGDGDGAAGPCGAPGCGGHCEGRGRRAMRGAEPAGSESPGAMEARGAGLGHARPAVSGCGEPSPPCPGAGSRARRVRVRRAEPAVSSVRGAEPAVSGCGEPSPPCPGAGSRARRVPVRGAEPAVSRCGEPSPPCPGAGSRARRVSVRGAEPAVSRCGEPSPPCLGAGSRARRVSVRGAEPAVSGLRAVPLRRVSRCPGVRGAGVAVPRCAGSRCRPAQVCGEPISPCPGARGAGVAVPRCAGSRCRRAQVCGEPVSPCPGVRGAGVAVPRCAGSRSRPAQVCGEPISPCPGVRGAGVAVPRCAGSRCRRAQVCRCWYGCRLQEVTVPRSGVSGAGVGLTVSRCRVPRPGSLCEAPGAGLAVPRCGKESRARPAAPGRRQLLLLWKSRAEAVLVFQISRLYPEQADGTAVDIFSFGMCALEMAVLEIQTNGDTRVSEEAIARARHSLDDPNMREFILSCLTLNPERRPSANSLLFHRVLFEVHSLKLLAAHCFINHQYLMPENVVEEKIKELDLNMVMAEIRREGRPGVQWRYSEVSFLELDKFLEDVRNGIYPLMNFAAPRPHALPRALSQPQEDPQKAKTPTPEPFDVETRKVVQMQCNMELNEDKSQWHLTLLLILEDKLHRQLSYDLLPTDNSKDLATELVHYGFIHEDDCEKLAAFLESAFLKHRSQPL